MLAQAHEVPPVRSPADQALRDLAGQPDRQEAFATSWHERLASSVTKAPGQVVPIRWSALPAHYAGHGGARPIGLHRALQNEYCEWSMRRHPASGKITRIDFTCESPEYWYTLWRVDPQAVLRLYRDTLGQPGILLQDLWLKNADGQPVMDAVTGQPQYDPLNAWNRGTEATPTGGGAMHLTHAPNALKSAITAVLGGANTRTRPVSAASPQPGHILRFLDGGRAERRLERHSERHIRLVTGLIAGQGHKPGLMDPPGSYMQMPDFSAYSLPASAPRGARAADYWRITRGTETLMDAHGRPLPGHGILHAVFEVPAEQGFAVGDMAIHGAPIVQAEQVAATLLMQLNVTQTEPDPATASQALRSWVRWPWRSFWQLQTRGG